MANLSPGRGAAPSAPQSLPITMSQPTFEEPEGSQCFVLVDGQAVRVLPGSSDMQQLFKEQETVLGGAGKSGATVVQDSSVKDSTGVEEHFEVVSVETDGKMEMMETVEVVHVEGNKTLEVMHIDTGKPLQVIHIEGSGKLDLTDTNKGSDVKFVVPPTTVFHPGKRGRGGQVAQRVKRVVGTPKRRQRAPPGQPGVRPIVVSTGKGSPSRPFCRVPRSSIFPSIRKSLDITPQNMNSNIIISGNKEILRGTGVALEKAIFISWPPVPPQERENTVGTQTDPCSAPGPSFNVFSCTFHADGSVETFCDFPTLCHKSVLTDGRARCWMARGGQHHREEEGEGALTIEGRADEEEDLRRMGTNQRISRSGRILKGKGPLFKSEIDVFEEDLEGDPDFEVPEEEEVAAEAIPQSPVLRRKRGRKRKKRPPSPDSFEEELQLAARDKEEEEEEEMSLVEMKKEVDVKEEPESDPEMALEIMRKKGYGLRTKRRPKKLKDMHYLHDQLVGRQDTDQGRIFPCRVCSRPFPTFFKLQRHAKQEHNFTNFSFPCDMCGMAFTRPHNLERHKETKHSSGQKRYSCEHCNRRFSRQDVLAVHVSNVHMRRANGPKGIATGHHCTGCDNYFSREKRLLEHRQGDFRCGECNIDFECRTALRLHTYKSHPSTCPKCGKICNSKHQMYFHQQTHSPRYMCKICNKTFIVRGQYAIHMATHTGDRNVPCDICGRTFAHKTAVSKHKWQEHNENNKKFKCEQCDKSFVYRGKLDSHMRSHTGEKPFSCDACNSTFSQRSNLNAHVKSVHGVVVKSVKSDGTTHTELVKYKRPKKTPAASSESAPPHSSTDIGGTGLPQEVELPAAPSQAPQIDIQDQVHMTESSLETEAAVYQIVYAYPQ